MSNKKDKKDKKHTQKKKTKKTNVLGNDLSLHSVVVSFILSAFFRVAGHG